MKLSCVIRNIPTSKPKLELADSLRMRGVHTRKRGRGARARPYGYIDSYGYQRYSGGEYQDLPMNKAARFNMYFDGSDGCVFPRLYYDYVGVTDNGKMKVRVHQ